MSPALLLMTYDQLQDVDIAAMIARQKRIDEARKAWREAPAEKKEETARAYRLALTEAMQPSITAITKPEAYIAPEQFELVGYDRGNGIIDFNFQKKS